MKRAHALAAILFTVAVLAITLLVQPAPAAEGAQSVHSSPYVANLAVRQVIAVTGTWLGGVVDTKGYDDAEIQSVIDQTDVNTLTISTQHSNDRVNWTDTALVSDNAADASAWATPTVLGAYGRLKVVTTNANPVTVTVLSLYK